VLVPGTERAIFEKPKDHFSAPVKGTKNAPGPDMASPWAPHKPVL